MHLNMLRMQILQIFDFYILICIFLQIKTFKPTFIWLIMRIQKSVVVFLFIFLTTNLVYANEIFIDPSSSSVTQGNNFNVEIKGNVYQSISDIYGIEYTINFNPSLLSVVNVVEGNLLNNGGLDSTIFDYELSPGIISIYTVRNSQTGIYKNGSFSVITFNALTPGSSIINIDNVIWVNSTITNQSVGIPGVTITNGSLTINPSSTSSSSSSSSDTGSSSGGGGTIINKNDSSQGNVGIVGFEINNPPENNNSLNETLEFDENENQNGFFRFTGGVINALTSGRLFKSWAFYFVLVVVAASVGVFFIRKKRSKSVSEY